MEKYTQKDKLYNERQIRSLCYSVVAVEEGVKSNNNHRDYTPCARL